MPQLSDTNKKIEKIQIDLIRQLSTPERISRLRSLSQTVINLSRRAIRNANPELSEKELKFKYLAYHYGYELAEKYEEYMRRTT